MNAARHFLLILFLAAFAAARAIVVDCRPGGLSSIAGADSSKHTELILTGTADASDLFFIAGHMQALRRLDMSGLRILAYSGASVGGNTRYAASTIPDGIFAGMRLEEVILPGDLDIGSMAFAQTALGRIVLPATTRRVGLGAFAGSLVTEAVLAPGAGYDTDVFNDCRFLERVDLAGITAIPAAFFKNCQRLSRVDGAASLESIGIEAFSNCKALEHFDFGAALARIGEKAFYRSGIVQADMSACALDSVERLTFMDCPALEHLSLPESCSFAGDYSFAGSMLHGGQQFAALSRIGRYSFYANELMASFELPATLSEIGDGAFGSIRHLSDIFVGKLTSVPRLGDGVFGDAELGKINLYVAGDMLDAFRAADVWKEFNILSDTGSGVTLPGAGVSKLRGRLSGESIELAAEGSEIEHVELFDASGIALRSLSPASESCTLSLGAFRRGTVLIVSARLADGSAHSLKFAL